MGLHVTPSLTLDTVGLVRKFQGDGDVDVTASCRVTYGSWSQNDGVMESTTGESWQVGACVSRVICESRSQYQEGSKWKGMNICRGGIQQPCRIAKMSRSRADKENDVADPGSRARVNHARNSKDDANPRWGISQSEACLRWYLQRTIRRFWGGVGMWPQMMFCWKRENHASDIFFLLNLCIYWFHPCT